MTVNEIADALRERHQGIDYIGYNWLTLIVKDVLDMADRELKSVIARYAKEKYPSEMRSLEPGQLPEFAGLTDDEISVLCEMMCHEGVERGFGSYWYE